MNKAKQATGAAMIALCLSVTACSSPSDGEAGNGNAAANERAIVENQTDPDPAPTKSILRPDVVEPSPEPTPLQPLDLVVAFDERGTALPDASKAKLDEAIASPAFQAGGAITLRGHSDTRGNDRANLAASRQRAELVRAYLIEKQVDPARLTMIAMGETTPLVPNAHPDGSDDPAARAKNRRVELHIDVPAPPSTTADAQTSEPADRDGNTT